MTYMPVSQQGRDPKYMPVDVLDMILSDLDDIEITAPADGEVLTYEAATSKWKNKPAAAAAINAYIVKGTTDTSTTSTAWVDVAQMTITETFAANKLLIIFNMSLSNDMAPDVGIEVDGVIVRQVRGEGYGISHHSQVMEVVSLETVTAGSHTIKGKWKLKNCGTLYNNISLFGHSRTLIVVELPT